MLPPRASPDDLLLQGVPDGQSGMFGVQGRSERNEIAVDDVEPETFTLERIGPLGHLGLAIRNLPFLPSVAR